MSLNCTRAVWREKQRVLSGQVTGDYTEMLQRAGPAVLCMRVRQC